MLIIQESNFQKFNSYKSEYNFFLRNGLSLPNICVLFHLLQSDGTCVLPLHWDGKWYDSGNGNITFENSTSTISSGWSLTTHGSTFNSWTCLASNSTGNLLLFRYVVFHIFCVFQIVKENEVHFLCKRLQSFFYACFRANSFVESSGVPQNVFKCIKWQRITDNSYIYHIMEGKIFYLKTS